MSETISRSYPPTLFWRGATRNFLLNCVNADGTPTDLSLCIAIDLVWSTTLGVELFRISLGTGVTLVDGGTGGQATVQIQSTQFASVPAGRYRVRVAATNGGTPNDVEFVIDPYDVTLRDP